MEIVPLCSRAYLRLLQRENQIAEGAVSHAVLRQLCDLVNFLIKEFKNDMNLLQRTHRFAGFAVLKSLDIPSVLIEMGYLSNLKDSKLLNDKNYHNKICDDILKAVKKYFKWKDKNTI